MKNAAQNFQEAVIALVDMGNGIGGTKISSSNPAKIRENLRIAFTAAKERSRRVENTIHL